MRNCFLLSILILCTISIYAQKNSSFSNKLLEKYSAKELKNLSENNPDSFIVLNYAAEKGYYFMDIPSGKNISFTKIENVSNQDLENFNPLKYNIEYFKEKQNYYILGDTGKLLVLMSVKSLKQYAKQENKSTYEK